MSENTTPAGEGLSDEEMARQVSEQTDSELKWNDLFREEREGVRTDTEVAKADADDLEP